METLPPNNGDFIDPIVSVSEADRRLSCVVLSVEIKPYLCGFYKLLKRFGIVEIIVSRTMIRSRCQDAKCDITTGIGRKTG